MSIAKVYIVKTESIAPSKASKVLFPVLYHLETGDDKRYEELSRGRYGKPCSIGGIYFNISHCEHYWAIVFSTEECGLDIEESRMVNKNMETRILAENEDILGKDVLNNWVLKEAYAKYLGAGLHLDFRYIDTESILKSENVINLSTKDYYCFLVSKIPTRAKVIWLDDKDLFTQ